MDQGPEPHAAYVHVPFCAHHCGYCDFAVATGQDHLIERYIDALASELSRLGEPRPIDTLFLGGGTPTYLGPRPLDRLLTAIDRWLPRRPTPEFSVEANPGTLDAVKVAVLADHGVTRVSLGAQSFRRPLLQVLERDHDPDDVPRAVAAIRRRIPHLALDLIFGVPGQTLADWEGDLTQALALAPDHVSTYGLAYEKGTRLWKQRRRGLVRPLDEDLERAMYLRGIYALEAAGFEHYEISNFARPGRRCRHNLTYWANLPYYGFGMGAARYLEGRREVNTRDLAGYIRRALAGEPTTFQSEELAPEERARETLVIQLRRAEGVRRPEFRSQTGFDLDELAGQALGRHVALGLLIDDQTGVRLSRDGLCVADAIMGDLL